MSSSETTGRPLRFCASQVSLPLPGKPDMTVTLQRKILVGNIMQIWLWLPKEREPGVVGGEGIRLVVATGFLGQHFPKMKILFGAGHLESVSRPLVSAKANKYSSRLLTSHESRMTS